MKSVKKKMYLSEIESFNRGGRTLRRWKDRVQEYMSERGTGRGEGLEQAKREALLPWPSLLGKLSETIDILID